MQRKNSIVEIADTIYKPTPTPKAHKSAMPEMAIYPRNGTTLDIPFQEIRVRDIPHTACGQQIQQPPWPRPYRANSPSVQFSPPNDLHRTNAWSLPPSPFLSCWWQPFSLFDSRETTQHRRPTCFCWLASCLPHRVCYNHFIQAHRDLLPVLLLRCFLSYGAPTVPQHLSCL